MVKRIAEFRRPEIVSALYRAIEQDGINLPGYDTIARHGDMSRQLIRHYYSKSEDMALALCEQLAATYKDCLMRGIIAADNSRRLKVFLDFYFGFLSEKGLPKPADDAVYDALFALANTDDAVKRSLREQYTLLQMTLSHEVMISHPTLPQRASHELGYLIVALMYGHWKMVASLGFSEQYSAVARDAANRLIDSYVERYQDPDAG